MVVVVEVITKVVVGEGWWRQGVMPVMMTASGDVVMVVKRWVVVAIEGGGEMVVWRLVVERW